MPSWELVDITSLVTAVYGTNLTTQGLGDAVDLGIQRQKYGFGEHTAASATMLLKHRFSCCQEPLKAPAALRRSFKGCPNLAASTSPMVFLLSPGPSLGGIPPPARPQTPCGLAPSCVNHHPSLPLSLIFSVLTMLLIVPGFSHSAPGHRKVLSLEELREVGLGRQKAHRQDGVNGHVLITSSKTQD